MSRQWQGLIDITEIEAASIVKSTNQSSSSHSTTNIDRAALCLVTSSRVWFLEVSFLSFMHDVRRS